MKVQEFRYEKLFFFAKKKSAKTQRIESGWILSDRSFFVGQKKTKTKKTG